MVKREIILSSLLLLVLSGCWNTSNKDQQKSKDDFYTVTGGWDWIRVPLLKPYEVKKIDPEVKTNSWLFQFQFPELYNTYNVKRVDVKDSIVYVLSGTVDEKNDTTIIGTRNVPTAWFVIDTKKKKEKGFASEEEFKAYIKENNYPAPQWHDIDSLSEALGNKGKLPWMPK